MFFLFADIRLSITNLYLIREITQFLMKIVQSLINLLGLMYHQFMQCLFLQILDLVSQGSVSLRQVRDIPGTLVGLYMWTCQRLFPDVTQYLHIARPIFNVILAARCPLGAQQIYDCLLTRNKHIRVGDRFENEVSKF